MTPTPEILLAIVTDLSTDHRCFKLAKSLRQLGYRPVIYCDQPWHALGPAWEGLEIRVLTKKSHMQGFFRAFAIFLFRLTPVLWRTSARVWISLDAPPLFWLALWGKLRGRTVVYDSHELFLETPLVLARPSRRLFWWCWEQGGFALIRKAITVSPAIVEKLRARHPAVQFHLLPNMPFAPTGQDQDAVKPAWKPKIRLIYQGGLRVDSGLPELFAALASRPDFRLDIYGDGPEAKALRAAAQSHGLEARVHFHGAVPFEKIPEAVAAAHFGIHLMQPTCGSFALTWANKIFDYARELTPMLLSDNPAHQALLREFRVGVAVDSFSPAAIGHGLDALVAGYGGFVEACRKARQHWHWEAYASGLKVFLEA